MRLLRIPTDRTGTVVARKNRFLAEIAVEGAGTVPVHVHDPGRLQEIVFPGNEVLVRHVPSPKRKTDWDLVAGRVGGSWTLVNASYHRAIAKSMLDAGIVLDVSHAKIRAEARLGESRIDFRIDRGSRTTWVEVKGCSLSRNGVALFPDAPSVRASRHVGELLHAHERGDGALVLMLIFSHDAAYFSPNGETDPHFFEMLHTAMEAGVAVCPVRCPFDGEWVSYAGPVPIIGRNGHPRS
jgi:sugar fermentation stimulation protein A